ncbi:MAG: PIG-L family deacetylase [Acidobacteriota bacterium]|nr:PIG-L family deacetylase [Acidobacteriota bacterium]
MDLAPPGVTTRVSAEKALVIAPHFDDDVLGCGGLIAQLTADGGNVAVLFLTDGSGGIEEIADRNQYAERRHQEAASALQILGVSDIEFLDLPDGSLSEHVDQAAEAIRRALKARSPDLLLAISPLEISADHRAAFAATHAALSGLRGGTDLDAAVEDLQILLYEANHPAFPNVLVDVTNQVDLVRQAIEAHASQLELHNYREMTLGLRSLRTASLSPDVKAAEGFQRLTVQDFVTTSRAALIRRLGGVSELHDVNDGPLISVIVRTKDRPHLLAEAMASLAAGAYRRVEVVLVNDGGKAPPVPDDFPFPVVAVNLPQNLGRGAAANAGLEAASGEWIAFLDDDDIAEPEHLATLAGLSNAAETSIVYTDAAVGVYEIHPDIGWHEVARRLPYSRDFDPELLLFDNYIPFNTLLIERGLFDEVGPFDTSLPFFEDWDMLIRLAATAPFHHLPQVTAEYRHFRGGDHILGERPTERADFLAMKARVIDKHQNRHGSEITARVVDGLRAEAIAAADSAAFRGAELETARRLFDRERAALTEALNLHRTAIAEHDENAQRLYAEIERLSGIIEAMEGTKAWGLHRTIEKLRGR